MALYIIRSVCLIKWWMSLDDARARLLHVLCQRTGAPSELMARRLPASNKKIQAQSPLNTTCTRMWLPDVKANRELLANILHNHDNEEVLDSLRHEIPAAKDVDKPTLLKAVLSVSEAERGDLETFTKSVALHLAEPDLESEREQAVERIKGMPAEQAKEILCDCVERFPEVARWLLESK